MDSRIGAKTGSWAEVSARAHEKGESVFRRRMSQEFCG